MSVSSLNPVPQHAKLFPDCAYININHLGLSAQDRIDRKHRLVQRLVQRSILLGVQELHGAKLSTLSGVEKEE